jgi:hypothetical protein
MAQLKLRGCLGRSGEKGNAQKERKGGDQRDTPQFGGCFPQLEPPESGIWHHTGSPYLFKENHIALAVIP